mmetsp:Transcript_11409/g.26818  ORF Transcript_11409/g.26818 Transcript_11409/m.26818 type:complete len:399 (-) Transcript_11409:180-1376(-)
MFKHDERNANERTDEDGPDYRSVMIQPLTTLPTFPGPLSPSLKLGNSSTKSSNLSRNNDERESNGLSSMSHGWKVVESLELPADYKLVRTNIYVKDAKPQKVADRICKLLNSASEIIGSRNVQEENSLVVETQSGVEFVIRICSSDDNVIVEVKRLVGCSLEFRDAAKTILRASTESQNDLRLSPPRRFVIPSTLPKRTLEISQNCIRDDLKRAFSMLHSKKSDVQLLGLESVEKMTKSSKTKIIAAKSVLSDYGCLKQFQFLLNAWDDNNQKGVHSFHSSCLRRKIFGVIANSCEAVGNSDLGKIVSMNGNILKTRSFLSFLLASMQDASTKPHDAFEAARCLRFLLVSKEVENAICEMSASNIIISACSGGFSSHRGLEQEANKLIVRLQNCREEE